MQTWGKAESALRLKSFPDIFWEKAYAALLGDMATRSEVRSALAPESFGHDTVHSYSAADRHQRYDYILLHKGMVSNLPIQIVASLTEFTCTYSNEVFLLLARVGNRKSDYEASRELTEILESYHDNVTNLWGKVGFIHIPKTAGTSIVNALRASMPAVKYVGRRDELGDVAGYHAVCGHMFLSDLIKLDTSFDLIFSVLRNPKERFLSAVAHCRRADEDPSTFSPSMRAMRSLSLVEYSQTEYFRQELCSTSIYLGWEAGIDEHNMEAVRRNALRQLEEYKVTLFDMDSLGSLERYMRRVCLLDWHGEKDNINKDGYSLFSPDEKDYIETGLETAFREENLFVQELENFVYRA